MTQHARGGSAPLEDLGISRHSSSAFHFLLSRVEANATEIIRALGTHRQLVYRALKDLEKRRLVQRHLRNGVGWYRVLNADALVEEESRRYEAATRVADAIRRQRKDAPAVDIVQIFEGVEGIHAFMDVVLKEARSIDILNGNARFPVLFPEIFDLWHEKREKKDIHLRVLLSEQVPRHLLRNLPKHEYRKFNIALFPSVLWIFSDVIAHVLWTSKRTSQVVLIRNPLLARQQRDLFSYLWKRGAPVRVD